jgi:hypothetical protein
MEFLHSLEVLRAELMDTRSAPDTANLTAQLHTQLRPTGQILDGFQLVVGSTEILDAEVDMATLIPATAFSKDKLRFQFWPRDISIRRNLLTSSWIDTPAHICSNEVTVYDEAGMAVHAADFMECLDNGTDHEPNGAAFQWEVIVATTEPYDSRFRACRPPRSWCPDAISLKGQSISSWGKSLVY